MRLSPIAAALATLAAAAPAEPPRNPAQAAPPVIAAQPVTETYYGTKVIDRFRNLEALDADTLAWMRKQGAWTRALFDSIRPRAAIERRMSELGGAFGLANSATIAGGRTFYMYRAPGADQFNLEWRDASGQRHVLIDTAALIKARGKPVAVDHFTPSDDGKRVAVAISESGSESSRLAIYDVDSGKLIGGPIWEGAFGGERWLPGGSGMFVSRLREPTPDMKPGEAYLNSEAVFWDGLAPPKPLVGTAYKLGPNTDPVRFPFIAPIEGSDQSLLGVANGVENEQEFWIAPTADARAGTAKWRKIVSTADGVTRLAASPTQLYFLSHKDAPGFKVTAAPLSGSAVSARTIVPEIRDQFIEGIGWAQDGLYITGRQRLDGLLLRYAGGRTTRIALPKGTTIGNFSTSPTVAGAIVGVDGPLSPGANYRYDPRNGKLADLKLGKLPPLNLAKFRAVSLDAVAADGARVPLSLLVPAGAIKPRPFLLDAYGAYGVSNLPYFNARRLVLAENGGGSAECSVRGGGELGEAWRLGGKDATKPNTWRDAIACAETLIKLGYTTREMLTITGTSAGGIMVGRAATERPDLFAGAISRVGDSNALRSETMLGGPANIPEFGTVKTEQGFKNLQAMDAYQHVVDGTHYPAWMLTTGLSDPRVSPWQATKMAARLMEASPNPVLLRIEEQAGHGIGTTRSTRDAEEADIAAFVFWRAGVPAWQPKQ